MNSYLKIICTVIALSVQSISAIELNANLTGFNLHIPAGWKKVGKESEFVGSDGFISPTFFDLYGKKIPITITSFRVKSGSITQKNIEENLKENLKNSMDEAKVNLDAPDYIGPKVLKADFKDCVISSKKVGGKTIYTTTVIQSIKGSHDESLVTKQTDITYLDGDHIFVLTVIGVLQHYRDYEKEIHKIVESLTNENAEPER